MGKQKKRRFALNLKKKSQAKPQSLTKGNDMNWIQTVFDYFGQSQSNDQQLPCARKAIIYNSELEYIRKCILGSALSIYALGQGPFLSPPRGYSAIKQEHLYPESKKAIKAL